MRFAWIFGHPAARGYLSRGAGRVRRRRSFRVHVCASGRETPLARATCYSLIESVRVWRSCVGCCDVCLYSRRDETIDAAKCELYSTVSYVLSESSVNRAGANKKRAEEELNRSRGSADDTLHARISYTRAVCQQRSFKGAAIVAEVVAAHGSALVLFLSIACMVAGLVAVMQKRS